MKKYISGLFCALGIMLSGVQAQEADGLLADVVTSTGDSFTIELRYNLAPRTVAHFMRLASGEQPWLDHATGRIIEGTPYYVGTQFESFQGTLPLRRFLQAGERIDGLLSESPGYMLRDEILRSSSTGAVLFPHQQYVVTMANDGPHSSGGRFLITLIQDAEFDGQNSAFGIVRQFYYQYNNQGIATGVSSGWVALQNIFGRSGVTISSITFRRRGVLAEGFDETLYLGELPQLGNIPITSLEHTSTHSNLNHVAFAGGWFRAYATLDLTNWLYLPLTDEYHGPGAAAIEQMPHPHSGLPSVFYRMIGVVYPTTTVPINLLGKTVIVGFGTPYAIRFEFDLTGLNSTYFRFADSSAGNLVYTYEVTGPYSAELHVTSPGLNGETYTLYFGGTDTEVSSDDLMSAEIMYPGFTPIDSHFTITP